MHSVKYFLWIIFTMSGHWIFGQVDSISYHFDLYGVFGSDGYPTHWLTSNRYGKFDKNQNDLVFLPGFEAPFIFGKHFRLDAGLDIAVKRNLDKSFIYQGYINLQYGKLKLMAGRQEFTLGQYGGRLSSGSFLISSNAIPIPRIGIGFYDYVDVPFTKGYLQIKGALNHGWLDGNRLEFSPYNNPLLHEKFAYIRTQKIPVNPYLGLAHVALYGGRKANGEKVGIDYKAVFTGKGSTAPGNYGEEINAAGEHLGILDLGIYTGIKGYDITVYYQFPVTDRTGMEKTFSRNKDFFTGIHIETDKHTLLSGFQYEFIHTQQQGGLGIPDPVVDGKIVEPWIQGDREFMKEYYTSLGYPVSSLNTELEWRSFLQAVVNHGYEFGGRVDFYNNYLYRYIYNERIIGTSLFITKPDLMRMTGYEDPGPYIVDNRIIAHHIGLNGFLNNNLDYRILVSYTRNKGAWQQYGGRTKWDGIALDPDYTWYWKGDKVEWYTMAEFNYNLPSLSGFSIKAAAGLDFGDLDKNVGILLGVVYRNYFKL